MAYRNQSTAFMLDIEIKSKDLEIDKSENGLLGRGGYGSVYIGKHKGKSVAVKMLSDNGIIPKTYVCLSVLIQKIINRDTSSYK